MNIKMKKLKRILCKHRFEYHHVEQVDSKVKLVYKCVKCGKTRK